ncbi:MAG TPA: DUF5060 domain-containing protein [Candidatus Acidoferrum sp.]|nr:DUF5060 domain-containing protein [Candidatus Acidoferrum sp.]
MSTGRACLFLAVLTVALGRVICLAQTNYVIDQFDSNTTASYANQHWGTAVPAITWSTNNATTGLATNTPGSGSAKWVIPWPTTGDQVMVTHSFGANLNLTQFTSISYDILFDASTATDGYGNVGAIEIDWIPAADGWPSTPNPPLATLSFAAGNTNWMHVTVPLSAAGNSKLTAVSGIGFKLQQKRTGANLSGTTTFKLDNIILGAPGPVTILPLNPSQLWSRLEFEVDNVPAFGNPFDPASISLNAVFTLPSGKLMSVPGFWYQGYQRSVSGGNELDTVNGTPGWRLRFTPPETGDYSLGMTIGTNGQTMTTLSTTFTVPSGPAPARYGYVGISTNHQYFQTGDGRALPLTGLNLAWPSGLATYDYDTWFNSLEGAGGNFARIWMCPWSFGIEDNPGTLTNYALAPAWQLDYVLQQAEQKGIYLQFTLVYHGMFATQPDYWGGNNYWPSNPYCVTNGGPCANPDAFFTSTTAKTLFQKRLRYLVARYGYSQNLLDWEFCNEIDNDYSFLSPTDVAAWHGAMGTWFHVNDPYAHLRTTSLTSASSYPEIWNLSQMDFCSEHAYTMSGSPLGLAGDSQSFLATYRKPIMIGEFGTSWQTWNISADPYLRGFREGIWAGALGGSTGTSMAWWWQNVASDNAYPVYSALTTILGRTGWGGGSWTNITFGSGQTQFSALGQRGPRESLLYLAATGAIFPAGATNASLPPQQNQTLTMSSWPPGKYYAEWYDPATGALVGTSQATTAAGKLTLPLPNYTADLAGIIYPPPTLSSPQVNAQGGFQLQLNSETGGHYYLLRSTNLTSWVPALTVTNATGTMWLTDSVPATAPAALYRAQHAP